MKEVILVKLKAYRNIVIGLILFLGTGAVLAALDETPEKEVVAVISQVENKDQNPTRTYTRFANMKNDKYDLHRLAAESFGVGIINNEAELEANIKRGKLVNVAENKGYKLHELTHSMAVLNPKAYDILKEVGVIFAETAGHNQFFVVTSLTRPLSSQEKLRKTNINATKNTSTHSYGASFDISYARFNGVKGDYPVLRDMMESILNDLKKQGKIYVLREKAIGCYHVTARK